MTSVATPQAALDDLREHLGSRRRQETDPFDTLYRIYVSGLLGLFGFYLALGLVDDVAIDPTRIEWARTQGPLWVSLVAAVAIMIGVRSGANGGPLAIDDLELHHVLLSPIDRATALRTPTWRMLRAAAGIGALLGAAAGELASRRLPGDQMEWVAAGLLLGIGISLSGVGVAFLSAALPSLRRPLIALSVVPVAWAALDLWLGSATSPTTGFGDLAFWPLDPRPIAAVAIVITVAAAVGGWLVRSRLSIERAHHRSQLVAQIRFAFAQQDIRSLLLLRRQLAFETPRRRPWFRIGEGGRIENRFPILVRDARSYARWPLSRIIRVSGLAVIAGLAVAAMWHGTTALIAVGGVALYLAAIEVIEPLSQELDHPGMLELIPVAPGHIAVGHVAAAAIAMSVVWIGVASVATLATLDWQVGTAMAIAALPGATAAVAAGALSIKRFDSPAMVVPAEVEGPRTLYRLLWPPLLTTAGVLPVLMARRAVFLDEPWVQPTTTVACIVALVAAASVGWIRARDDFSMAAQEHMK
ncbi:MAG: hypothetical protein R2707_00110 [Acidimicrobiales bacterium]